jgi:two-component system, NtrC family, nitrogen regulation sensor histidine kinase NtrY
LVSTIVRQVGDIRRMIDEFSSFARMPKPTFAEENLVEIARHALFLHEVAHPGIDFALEGPGGRLAMVCDRRQLGQALTNLFKNAVEAIEARGEGASRGTVAIRIAHAGERVVLEIADNGIGLPAERERLTEPYMTTRAKGTGLGLAIVDKIVEEHLGDMQFEDRPGGGTLVRLSFDPAALSPLAGDAEPQLETIRRA